MSSCTPIHHDEVYLFSQYAMSHMDIMANCNKSVIIQPKLFSVFGMFAKKLPLISIANKEQSAGGIVKNSFD